VVIGHAQVCCQTFKADIGGDVAAVEEAEKIEQSDLREGRKDQTCVPKRSHRGRATAVVTRNRLRCFGLGSFASPPSPIAFVSVERS